MRQFKKILVYLQQIDKPNEAMIKRAILLAKRNEAEITFSTRISALPANLEEFLHSQLGTNIVANHRKSTLTKLESIVESKKQKDQRVNLRIFEGRPFIAVIKEVLSRSFDLVMVEPDTGGSVNKLFFGTTAMNLLRKCPCPVWVFKPAVHGTYRRILASIDTSTKREEERELNKSIMEIAVILAEREDAELHVVHCWEASGETILRSNVPPAQAALIEEYSLFALETASKKLEEFLKSCPYPIKKNAIHLERGVPGRVVPELVHRHHIELVVMGTLGRLGLKGLFMGNSAEKIIDGLDCSVLALKPEGFVSPVRLG